MALAAYSVNETATVIHLDQKRAEYMGNPQLEDGHTRIANELFEAIIRFPFSSRQLKVVMAVIRKTYGFNKKQDRLALSTISEMTGVIKTHVCQAVKQLGEMNVLDIDASGFSHRIALNKNYMDWKSRDRNGHSDQCSQSDRNSHEIVTETVTKPLPKQSPQKKERKKDNSAQIPDWIPCEPWVGFVEMRKAIKKPMTARAMALIVNKLVVLRDDGYNPAEVLDQSTLNNWQGVFATKTKPVVAGGQSALPDFMRGAL